MTIGKRRVVQILFATIGLFALAQIIVLAVPVFHPSNPPIYRTVQWDTPETEALWNRACRDCHSSETIWPWYSYIFPSAVLVAHDVTEGREEFNVSNYGRVEIHEMRETLEEGEMPPAIYTIMHPEARLTSAEREQLIQGLRNTFGRDGLGG